MVFIPFIVSLALVPFVVAQSNNTALQIEAIEAHFTNAGIVPSLLTTFTPSAVLNLSYTGVGTVSPGEALTQTQVAPTPTLIITPANSTVNLTGLYTLAMVDAGPVGTDESQGQTRHWLVNGVVLAGEPLNVSTSDGTAITEYAGPAPASGSGAHRYVILLYAQPSTFQAPSGLDTANVGVSSFDFNNYVSTSGLGDLVAGTYITVEEGSASFTPSSTAAVVTSTLADAQSTASVSSSGSSSSSGTATGQKSTTTGTASSARFSKDMSLGMMVAALVGVVGVFML